MYALTQKSEHIVWKEQWYALTLGVSLRTNLYMTQEDQVFVVDVVAINLTREMVASNVISSLACAIVKLSTIVKIHRYKTLHEGHHFIPMAMNVHDALERDMDRFIIECVHLFHDRRSKDHLSLFFCTQFFR
jgi:hypothetical protein